jgi:hypothetical protein
MHSVFKHFITWSFIFYYLYFNRKRHKPWARRRDKWSDPFGRLIGKRTETNQVIITLQNLHDIITFHYITALLLNVIYMQCIHHNVLIYNIYHQCYSQSFTSISWTIDYSVGWTHIDLHVMIKFYYINVVVYNLFAFIMYSVRSSFAILQSIIREHIVNDWL